VFIPKIRICNQTARDLSRRIGKDILREGGISPKESIIIGAIVFRDAAFHEEFDPDLKAGEDPPPSINKERGN